MAQIANNAKALKTIVFKLGTNNYEFHVNKVEFTNDTPTIDWDGFNGARVLDTGTPKSTLNLDYAQDWTTPNSLTLFLFANVGTSFPVEYTLTAGGPKFTSTVTVTTGSIGGAVNTIPTASVSLPATFPVLVPAA